MDFKGAMVRRRRWIRSRVCVGDEAKENLKLTIDLLVSERSKIESCLVEMHGEYDALMAFEQERAAVSEHISTTSSHSLSASVSSLKFFVGKLNLIRQVSESVIVVVVVVVVFVVVSINVIHLSRANDDIYLRVAQINSSWRPRKK